jgi:hypothetical protein
MTQRPQCTRQTTMQSNRDGLQYLYDNVTHDRNQLRKLCPMAPSTFRRNIRKLELGSSLVRNPGSGAPTKLDPNDQRRIVGIALMNPMPSSKQVNAKLATRTGKIVTARTIRRRLANAGVRKVFTETGACPNRHTRRKASLIHQPLENLRLQNCVDYGRIHIPVAPE